MYDVPDHLALESPSSRELDRRYPLPRDTRTREDWERARHYDLPALALEALNLEGRRVVSRLDHEPDRHSRAWLTERLEAIRTEHKRRRDAFAATESEQRRRWNALDDIQTERRRHRDALRLAPAMPVEPASVGYTPLPVRGGGRRGR